MPKGLMLFISLGLSFLLFACSFTDVDPEAFDHVATAASFAQGEGTIALAVSGTVTAEADIRISKLRVAYVDDGDLWVWMEISGSKELIDPVGMIGDLRLSDNGGVIAFLLGEEPDNLELWAINWDGSDPRFLTDATNLTFSNLRPDRLVFGAARPDDATWDLMLHKPDGQTRLIASPIGEKIIFDFSIP
ncbi:MAG: hypothetical protein DWQ07_13295 [Chloroflexi bacterium]|nr:MAG: hypothetical protein DWQ07_13295 [Chloroflexota bacterium]MBL1196789.1 hypothetical protein [Chloroflexota bacterium]NOH14083.1 hypothetical protein [Chloroflexota bacterium]